MKNLELLQEEITSVMGIEITEIESENVKDEMDRGFDFHIELDGNEYRFISESAIDDIYHDEQMELIKECYLDGKDLPWWFEIDWDKTVENVLNADGYGHHFSQYDGSEETFRYDGELWYVFRTN